MTVKELKELVKDISDGIEIQKTGPEDKIPVFSYIRWITPNNEIKEIVNIN